MYVIGKILHGGWKPLEDQLFQTTATTHETSWKTHVPSWEWPFVFQVQGSQRVWHAQAPFSVRGIFWGWNLCMNLISLMANQTQYISQYIYHFVEVTHRAPLKPLSFSAGLLGNIKSKLVLKGRF